MPRPGVKPSTAPRRNTAPLAHEWVDVVDVPYAGKVPPLPAERNWQSLTRSWWRVVSRMPHCVLWTDAEWKYALETAVVADAFYTGAMSVAGELRRRECALGLTMDARRDLRIRYVDPADAPGVSMSTPAASDPRARLRVVGGGDDDAA